MDCVAIGFNDFCAGVLTLDHFDCLRLCHSRRNCEVQGVPTRMSAIACGCQAFGYQRVLVRLCSEAACGAKAYFGNCRKRVEVSAENRQ